MKLMVLCTVLVTTLAKPNGFYHQEYNYRTSSSSYKNHELQHQNDDEGFYSKDGDLEGRLKPRVNAHSQHSEYVNPKLQHGYRMGTDRTSSFGQLNAQDRFQMGEDMGGYGFMGGQQNYGMSSDLRQVTSSLQQEMERELQSAVYDHYRRASAYGGSISQMQVEQDRRLLEEELRRNMTMRLQEALKVHYGNQGMRGGYSYSIINGRLQPTANYNTQELADLTRQMEENLLRHLNQQVQTHYHTRVDTQVHSQRNTYRHQVNEGDNYPSAMQQRPVYHPYSQPMQPVQPQPHPMAPIPDSITTVATRVQTELNEILNKILEDTQRRYFSQNSFQSGVDYDRVLGQLQEELRANISFHFSDQIKRTYGYSNYASKYSVEDIENLRRQIETNLLTKLNRDFIKQREKFFQSQRMYVVQPIPGNQVLQPIPGNQVLQPIPGNQVYYPVNNINYQRDIQEMQRQLQEQMSRQLQTALMQHSYRQAHMYSGSASSFNPQSHYQATLEQLSAELNRNLTRQMEMLNVQQFQNSGYASQLANMRNQLQSDLMRQLQQGLQQSYSRYSSWSASSASSSSSGNYRPVRGFDPNAYSVPGGEDCMMGDDPSVYQQHSDEDLTQQTEDLTQQAQDLTQEAQGLTQQSQDLTQEAEEIIPPVESPPEQKYGARYEGPQKPQSTEDIEPIYHRATANQLYSRPQQSQNHDDLDQQVQTLDHQAPPKSHLEIGPPVYQEVPPVQRYEAIIRHQQAQQTTPVRPVPIRQHIYRYRGYRGQPLTQQNQYLTQQNQDWTQQNQDLTQQTQDLTQQNQDLTQQSEDLTQQRDLDQQVQTLDHQTPSKPKVVIGPPVYHEAPLEQTYEAVILPQQAQQITPLKPIPVRYHTFRYHRYRGQDMGQQGQYLSQPNQVLTQQNQDLTQQSQDLTQQSQDLTQQSQSLTQQSQGLTQQSHLTQQNQDLTQQSQDLTQQSQDLTQQSQDLTQQSQDLTQQSQDLTQQSQDLTQQGQDLTQPSQSNQQTYFQTTNPSIYTSHRYQSHEYRRRYYQSPRQYTSTYTWSPSRENIPPNQVRQRVDYFENLQRGRHPYQQPWNSPGVTQQKPVSQQEPIGQETESSPGVTQQQPVSQQKPIGQETESSLGVTQQKPVSQQKPIGQETESSLGVTQQKPVSQQKPIGQETESSPGVTQQKPVSQQEPIGQETEDSNLLGQQTENDDLTQQVEGIGFGKIVDPNAELTQQNQGQQVEDFGQQARDLTQQSQDLTQQSQDLTQQTEDEFAPLTLGTGSAYRTTSKPVQQNQDLTQQSEDLTQQTQDLEHLSQQNQQLTQQAQDLTLQNQYLAQHSHDLNRQTEDLTQQNKYLSQQSQDLTQQREDLTQQNQDLTQQTEDLTQHSQDLTHQFQDLIQQNQELTQQSQDLTQQVEDLTQPQQNEDLGQQSQDLTQQTQDLTQQSEDIYQPVEPQISSNKIFRDEPTRQQLAQQTQDLIHQEIGHNQQLSQSQQKPYYTQQTQDLTQQSEDLTQQNEDLTQQAQDLTQQAQDLTEKAQDLTQQNEDLTQQSEDLTQQSEDLTQQSEDLTQQSEDLTQQSEDLAQQTDESTTVVPQQGIVNQQIDQQKLQAADKESQRLIDLLKNQQRVQHQNQETQPNQYTGPLHYSPQPVYGDINGHPVQVGTTRQIPSTGAQEVEPVQPYQFKRPSSYQGRSTNLQTPKYDKVEVGEPEQVETLVDTDPIQPQVAHEVQQVEDSEQEEVELITTTPKPGLWTRFKNSIRNKVG